MNLTELEKLEHRLRAAEKQAAAAWRAANAFAALAGIDTRDEETSLYRQICEEAFRQVSKN